MNEPIDIASGRYLNESAIRAHALQCSKQFRAGKFTRVGQDFIDEVKTDVECLVRNIRGQTPVNLDEPLESAVHFATGELIQRMHDELDRLIGRIIQNKVKRQPTVGVTLSRTR